MPRSFRGWVVGGSDRSRPAPRARLRAEALEGRWCPAFVGQVGSTLFITGDAVGETVTVEQNDSPYSFYGGLPADKIRVTYVGNGSVIRDFTSSSITAVEIDLGEGDDTLRWTVRSPMVNYPLAGNNKAVSIETDGGEDFVWLRFDGTGGIGATLYNRLEVDIDTGSSRDEVYAYFGEVAGTLDFAADLGSTGDYARVGLRGQALGHVTVELNGEGGSDDLWVGGGFDPTWLLPFKVGAGGTAIWDVDGGSGIDTLRADYRGEMDGDLVLYMNGSTGDDTVTAAVDLQSGSTGTLDAFLYGGADDDRLSLRVYERAGSSVYLLGATMDGGTGFDRWGQFTTLNVDVVNCEGVWL